MEDITELLEHYRECVRHLWNSGYLRVDTPEDEWDVIDQFSDIASRLFSTFVLIPIGRRDAQLSREYDAEPEPFPFLWVVPSGSGSSIFINRSSPPGGYWDDPIDTILRGEADLNLISYFDFDVLGPRDLEYYLVRITRFDKHPHLVGRNALIRVKDTRVLHEQGDPQ